MTVSIAAETIGIWIVMPRVSWVAVETSFGRTRDSAGTSRTSSNVSPSFPEFPVELEEPLDLTWL